MKTLRLRVLLFSTLSVLILANWTDRPQWRQAEDVIRKAQEKIPDLSSLLAGGPALTTSLNDALTEVTFLDGFDPPVFSSMAGLPRGPGGEFRLVAPGFYRFRAESYCLKAGTHGPGSGEGYLYAPLAGPRAAVVRKILRNSYAHPDVPTHRIQALLWAIIARTKISDMAPEMKLTAAQLLSPDEILELNGGALAIVQEQVLQRSLAKAAPAVRPVLEAEARLRRMLTQAESSYDQLERVAVLAGEPATDKEGRDIRRGRWSYHPVGYFVRYFPSSYTRDTIELVVPDPFAVERDSLGRIARLARRNGTALTVQYQDETPPLTVDGAPGLRGFVITKVTLDARDDWSYERPIFRRHVWTNPGWTFCGPPEGAWRVKVADSRYHGAQALLDSARQITRELEGVLRGAGKHSGHPYRAAPPGLTDLVDLAHLALAFEKSSLPTRGETWFADPAVLVKRAWMSALCRAGAASSSSTSGLVPSSYEGGPFPVWASLGPLAVWESLCFGRRSNWDPPVVHASDGDAAGFDPSENVATPGNAGRQRIGNSGRGESDDCEAVQKNLRNALAWLDGFSNPDLINQAKGVGDYSRLVDEYVTGEKTPPGKPPSSYETDAYVSSKCEVGYTKVTNGQEEWVTLTFDGLRDRLGDKGYSQTGAEGVVIHERTHMQQCWNWGDTFTNPTPADLGRSEREAYCAEAKFLMDYLRQKCGGVPADMQEKFDKLCR